MLKAVIFDVDGTLVDSVGFHAQAWVKAFKEHGYEFTHERLRQQIGKGGEYIVEELLPPEDAKKLGNDISSYRKEFYQENLLSQIQPFEQVKELFERLRADGLKVVLASSARQGTLKHYEQLLKIEDLIDGATSTNDVEKSKPEPDIFAAALDKLNGVAATEVMVVGDSPYDAQAASKLSLPTVGVLSGGFSEAVLKEAGCIAIYRHPADLLANYENSPLYPSQKQSNFSKS